MKVYELFEASTPGRAWNRGLEKIDKLLYWMYEKDILSATDKAKKDTVFYQYYRYYNDGDIPAALKRQGFSKNSNKIEVETALEEYLETFIKKMLSKYLPVVDRKTFRIDNAIEALSMVEKMASEHDAYSLLTYWVKKVKKFDENFLTQLDTIQKQYDKIKAKLDAESPSTKNTTLQYRIEKMKNDKTLTAETKKLVNELYHSLDILAAYVKNLIRALEDIKDNLS